MLHSPSPSLALFLFYPLFCPLLLTFHTRSKAASRSCGIPISTLEGTQVLTGVVTPRMARSVTVTVCCARAGCGAKGQRNRVACRRGEERGREREGERRGKGDGGEETRAKGEEMHTSQVVSNPITSHLSLLHTRYTTCQCSPKR